MRVANFSTKPYDQTFLDQANQDRHDIHYLEARLTADTASLAQDFDAVCAFVNDELNRAVIKQLAQYEIGLIALRSAGFNHVDLEATSQHGMTVARVPAYSPNAVAEHTLALILTLNRKTYRAYNRVRDGNLSLDGLMGFDLNKKTVGVIGTGNIGTIVARIMDGIGCRVLAHDVEPNPDCQPFVEYVDRDRLFHHADIITLHCPLTPDTHHLIDQEALCEMKDGVMLINTSRGALIDTRAVITALKNEKVGHLGLDVYEEEEQLFFEDLSDRIIKDDVFSRLLTFPNVVITGHQGFFTEEALQNIASTTIHNITAYETGEGTLHEVTKAQLA